MSRPGKKLCIITNRYPAHADDTASPFVKDFHLELWKKGIEVTVYTPAYKTDKVDTEPGVNRFHWTGGSRTIGELNLFSVKGICQLFSFLREGKRHLFDLIAKEKPDHCLALWALPSGWLAGQAKQKFGIPYSVWCLGSDIYVWGKKPVFRQITRRVLREAEFLFADGFDLCQKTARLAGKVCRFMPSQRRLPEPTGETPSPLDNKFDNFLYFGRWEKSKGLEDLLLALRMVADQNPRARLHLLGWGSYQSRMAELIENLRLHNFVNLVGKVDSPALSSYLKNCDWVVIPSRGDSIPLVLSEALQFAKPVIATDVGDLGNLTREYNLGKVIPPGRPERLAQAMLDIAAQREDFTGRMPELLQKLSVERAVETFLETLGWNEPSTEVKPKSAEKITAI